MKTIYKSTVLAILLIASFIASATFKNPPPQIKQIQHGDVIEFTVKQRVNMFDFYQPFTLTITNDSAIDVNLLRLNGISDFNLSFLGNNVDSNFYLDRQDTHFGLNLSAGEYHLGVSGKLDSFWNGGKYKFSLAVTPVPEASTIALMLSGLGIVGFMARRKKLIAA